MRSQLEKVLREVEKVIVGKRKVIEKILMALLADGHILLDDVPGVGKTTLAVALSRAIGLSFQRVQFTPDVLPSDLVGFSMYDKATGSFMYRPGALNRANLVLGDEINRAASKTQSALLEAMEERQVTVDGETYPLETPFVVIATENSVGTAGTQRLPYAQMDRFLVRLSLGYPDYEAQMAMLRDRQGRNPLEAVACVMEKEELLAMQREVRAVTSKDAILDYITRLTLASREHEAVEVGVSPRGTLFIDRMAKARAYLENRDYVTGGDVQAVFPDVCAHRVLLKDNIRETTVEQVLNELLKKVENPDRRGFFPGMKK
ncbi:MAG: MoxR family ATPase [Clostridia bacterium]|nr:MoxR family ATPase [Clostridia bacterium]